MAKKVIRMFYLYAYTNLINGMVYIGQTKNIKVRDQKHCNSTKSRVDQAINQFGRNNFSLTVIMFSQNKKVIELAEIEWIRLARIRLGRNMVYNVSNGGPLVWLGLHHSDSAIEKMRHSHTGLHDGENNPMFNKSHSPSSKKLMSQNRKGKSFGEKRPNSKLTKDEAESIKTDSRSERVLAKIYGVSRSTINNIKRGVSWK